MENENFIINKNRVHKIVNGGSIVYKGQKLPFCYIDSHPKFIQKEVRGKKAKFWIKHNNKNAYLLKYEMRNNDSLDNAGQFIMEGILDKLGIPHAEYYIVDYIQYEKDGKKSYDAIMTKNYKKENEVEISGYIFNNKVNDREYDNNMGQSTEHHHTVEGYMDCFRKLYGRNNINFKELERDMLKYCLIQYVYAMSDLHYYNLSFLYDESIGHKSMRVTPFYDCGNICCLNLSTKRGKNIYEQFKNTRNIQKYVEGLLYYKMPMFGVKTDISIIYKEKEESEYICRSLCETGTGNQEKEKIAKEVLDVFRKELANEILKDKELMDFYNNIKTKVDVEKICQKYNDIREGTIPEECVFITKKISEHNLSILDEYLVSAQKNLTQENQPDKKETEYDVSEMEIYKYLALNKEKERDKW